MRLKWNTKRMIDHYEVRRLKIEDLLSDRNLANWIEESFEKNRLLYNGEYNWRTINVVWFLKNHYFAVCFRNKEPVGIQVATLSPSLFDPTLIQLKQVTLFAVPNTRATYHLMRDFIDFGKANANYIYTMVAAKTNIKGRSLEKLGFNKIEELYRLEAK